MSTAGSITDADLRTRENNFAHHTWEIDRERLIVRRGQPFSITLQCSGGSVRPGRHLELVLHLGKRAETVIKLQKERGSGASWWFSQQEAQGEVLLTLHSPADAAIGHYRLAVLVLAPDGHILQRLDKIQFHLLFNPWCKDDVVHLPDEGLLQEYIMNEDGVIYRGEWYNITSSPWNYGQFEDYVMDICFEVLDNSRDALKNPELDLERRSDPVYVSRVISAMVNANGDRGVLEGRWMEPYTDGVTPTQWTGSVPILRQWSQAGLRAVKYGQCWVFAGVACTVMRCLGIPTRLITNFSSAHDVDGNLSIDFLMNEKLESLGGNGKPEINWNYHCWIESWMKRDDLPNGNDGWQVLDPTPQELSEGVYCCGPCPVVAIKEGNLGVKYDAPFVFAEVNADIVYWIVYPDGQRQKIKVNESGVGKNISTKSVYGDDREDVTLHYKYPEGSKKEREVYEKAGRRLMLPTNNDAEPGKLQISIKHAKPVFGTDFDVIVKIKNEGASDARVQLTLLVEAVTYNSLHRGACQRQRITVTVPAHKVHQEVQRVHYKDYAKCVSEHHLIRVKHIKVRRSVQLRHLSINKSIHCHNAPLCLQVEGRPVIQQPTTVYISFTNPLPVPLKGGVFTVEGAGLLPATKIYADGDISAGQTVSVKLSFSPMRTGVRNLLVDFDSDRLKDVKGFAKVVVRKKYRDLIRLM
uniref:protein-glutamine gamma-glutamyltransferase n=1 Tax=Salarias fasciatus TaxID=181472 RepID=A0A672FPJ7_SALFA